MQLYSKRLMMAKLRFALVALITLLVVLLVAHLAYHVIQRSQNNTEAVTPL